jgi:iron complex outermembrane receptor protein
MNMKGGPPQPPCWLKGGILLSVWLLLPGPALAQSEAAPGTAQPGGQTATQQAGGAADNSGKKILDLDIEQLAKTPVVVPSMDIPVTSVTKEQSTVGRSPAAIFVITPEMIRRSGATCIPEALRMAPGLEVAQINSNTWAITCRGFNAMYANKLLVLIDGRSVYDTNTSGVFWNVQDVLLEDVERIEVIRGPGGTLWGANAVNGVINIITKKAKDTQGAYLMGGGGTHDRVLDGFRYGGRIGEDLNYRIYGKTFDIGPGVDPTNVGNDAWRQGRCGFRADWEPDHGKADSFTLQGDYYQGSTGNNAIILVDQMLPSDQFGENVLARWRHIYDANTDWQLQTYYDQYTQTVPSASGTVKTFDIDFQCRFAWGDRQKITCGSGFRDVECFTPGTDGFTPIFPTPYFTTNYTNQFIQDEIALVDERLVLTLGVKLEQNPYTGLEYQPTARLLFAPDHKHSFWCAVSRAVRTPARDEEQPSVTLPALPPQVFPEIYPRLFGSDNLASEDMWAYEIGYREQTTDQFSWDIATFYNVYGNLIGTVPGQQVFPEWNPPPFHLVLPLYYVNGPSGDTYGVELSGNYAISKTWRLYAQYSVFEMQLSASDVSVNGAGCDPHNQVYLRSSWDLRENLQFDLMFRYVDSLAAINVPSYTSMDLRLAWRPRKNVELAVVGQNLLQSQHWEYTGTSAYFPTEIPRSVYSTLTWRY